MRWGTGRAGVAAVCGWCVFTSAALAGAPAPTAVQAGFGTQPASAEAIALGHWVRESRDAAGRPYAIVDKRQARLYVFDAQGRLAGATPALLGSTPGDHTVPGVGLRAQTGQVGQDERTTPAGRFEATPGRNLKGEHVVWADYASAFAIHRLRPGAAYEARKTRLESETSEDNRVSYGCVVVSVAFYLSVVEPVLGHTHSVVYVLPETRPVQQLLREL
jgi:hypothetical protein